MKTGTVKIRFKGLKIERPTTLRILPKLDADFEIDGTADIPARYEEQLLSPSSGGRFELVVEKKPDAIATKKVAPRPVQQPDDKTQEFVKDI